MKWAGAAYLAWMGWRMIRSASRATGDLADVARKSKFAAFRYSALVTLLNPESIGFFLAFVPQFIDLAVTLCSKVARPYRMAWLQRCSGAVLIGLAAFITTLRRA